MLITLASWIISFLIVGLGEPTRLEYLGPLASSIGVAIFWKGLPKQVSAKKKFIWGVVWFSFVQMVHISWMTSTTYQGIYIIGVWLGLCVAMGVQFGLLTLFVTNANKITGRHIAAAAALWTIFEWSRLYFLCGYTFSLLGIALASNVYSLQTASIVGIYGMSFWVVATNLYGLRLFQNPTVRNVITFCMAASIPYLIGWGRLLLENKSRDYSEARVALVQTGLLPGQKYFHPAFKNEFVSPDEQWKRILIQLGTVITEPFQMIVLPEAAIPYSARETIYPAPLVREVFKEALGDKGGAFFSNTVQSELLSNADIAKLISEFFQVPLLIGLNDYENAQSFNAALYFQPGKESYERYDKQVLLPLVEYLPFKWLLNITKKYGITDFFTPGKEPKVFQAIKPFAVSICYEETFSPLVRLAVERGAHFLINISNDAWFPFSNLTEQHFQYGRIRAVENGVPLIRACNTGVTAAVDSKGRIIGRLEANNKNIKTPLQLEVLVAKVKIEKIFTVYSVLGESTVILISIFLIGYYCFYVLINKRVNIN